MDDRDPAAIARCLTLRERSALMSAVEHGWTRQSVSMRMCGVLVLHAGHEIVEPLPLGCRVAAELDREVRRG